MKIVGIYNPPAFITLTGLLSSLTACWLAFAGELELAVIFLFWSGIFDMFDGMLARKLKVSDREALFGVQIDSIADMACFGLSPVVVAIGLGMDGVLGYVASAMYVCAAAQRLAYFNVLAEEAKGSITTYTGLPVTLSALIFGILFTMREFLSPEAYSTFLALLFMTVAVLFVAPIKIPKPKGKFLIIFPLLAIYFTWYWLHLYFSA